MSTHFQSWRYYTALLAEWYIIVVISGDHWYHADVGVATLAWRRRRRNTASEKHTGVRPNIRRQAPDWWRGGPQI